MIYNRVCSKAYDSKYLYFLCNTRYNVFLCFVSSYDDHHSTRIYSTTIVH